MPGKTNGNGRVKLAKLEQRLCDHLEQNQYFREETGDKLSRILDKIDGKASGAEVKELEKDMVGLRKKVEAVYIKALTTSGIIAVLGSFLAFIILRIIMS